jgi:hypothetical protein
VSLHCVPVCARGCTGHVDRRSRVMVPVSCQKTQESLGIDLYIDLQVGSRYAAERQLETEVALCWSHDGLKRIDCTPPKVSLQALDPVHPSTKLHTSRSPTHIHVEAVGS